MKANEEVDDDAELRELERRDPTVIKKFDLVRDRREGRRGKEGGREGGPQL